MPTLNTIKAREKAEIYKYFLCCRIVCVLWLWLCCLPNNFPTEDKNFFIRKQQKFVLPLWLSK